MIDWITGWVAKFAGIVGQGVIDLVHWGLHALASVINGIFGEVSRAWHEFWVAMVAIERACGHFGAAVYGLAVKVLRYWVPRLIRDLRAAALSLWRGIRWVWSHALHEVNALRRLAWKWVTELWRLVLRDVWKPLRDYALHLYHLIVKWAYVAWWWITHLDKLAEAMIYHLVASLERHAWDIAARLGRFVTALVLHNARRLALLAEQILAAVI